MSEELHNDCRPFRPPRTTAHAQRVAAQCVNTLTPKPSSKLAGFDVYCVWDQCYAMEQSLRIE